MNVGQRSVPRFNVVVVWLPAQRTIALGSNRSDKSITTSGITIRGRRSTAQIATILSVFPPHLSSVLLFIHSTIDWMGGRTSFRRGVSMCVCGKGEAWRGASIHNTIQSHVHVPYFIYIQLLHIYGFHSTLLARHSSSFFFLNQLFIDLKNLLFDIFKNSLCAAAKYKIKSFQTFAEVKDKN
jgi:hypothetical protein